MAKILLALHGFHSSPASLKAQQMSEYVAQYHPEITFLCPQLPCFPAQMWACIESIFAQNRDAEIAVMGSSLGGFLATKAAQQYQAKVLLINPAVHPDRLLSHSGAQKHPYTFDEYVIDDHYLQQLLALKVNYIGSPDQCWVLLQQADDVLDYRQALQQYEHCKITCEEGGDHSFVGFERYLQDIIKFLF